MVSQLDLAKSDECRDRSEATKIIKLENFFRRSQYMRGVLKDFKHRYAKFTWYIGTIHMYKKISAAQKKKLSKLSYISDTIRRGYRGVKIVLYLTQEKSEDREIHYHYLLGLPIIDDKRLPFKVNIRNMKLWSREWELGAHFSYIRPEDNEENPGVWQAGIRCDHYEDKEGLFIRCVDPGYRQRWFKYGIYKYLLYIFKYSKFSRYIDYIII